MKTSKAFYSQYQEVNLTAPKVSGKIPPWLFGQLISNGPAQFEIGQLEFQHWFDGLAMLKKFEFNAGRVQFQNHFLHSSQYLTAKRFGTLYTSEFATYKDNHFIKRCITGLKHAAKGVLYDNCNVNIARIANTDLALTESKNILTFDEKTLHTTGYFHFEDDIREQLTTAHPQIDGQTKAFINVAIQVGRYTDYQIYSVAPQSLQRKLIYTYRSEKLFYIHSFSITPHYVILLKTPLVIQPFKLLFGVPFNLCLYTEKDQESEFIFIHRQKGHVTTVSTHLAFVCLHHVNAYEVQDELFLDLICHPAHNPYDLLYLDNLRAACPKLPEGKLIRFQVTPHTRHCTHEVLSHVRQEFPRIHEKMASGQKYQFIYTSICSSKTAKFFDQLQKFDLNTNKSMVWGKKNYLLGEAVFVGHPKACQEDHGVLLCIAYDTTLHCSSLVIINAQDMQKIAEVFLPFHLPMGLHGYFTWTS